MTLDPSEIAGYAYKVLRMLEAGGPTDADSVALLHGEPVLDYLIAAGTARLSLDGSLLEITGDGIRQIRLGSR